MQQSAGTRSQSQTKGEADQSVSSNSDSSESDDEEEESDESSDDDDESSEEDDDDEGDADTSKKSGFQKRAHLGLIDCLLFISDVGSERFCF